MSSALAEALKTNSALTSLDLKGNSMDDEGAWALAEAFKTNSARGGRGPALDLYDNPIGDEALAALSWGLW